MAPARGVVSCSSLRTTGRRLVATAVAPKTQILPAWLQLMQQDSGPAPILYAWTAANLGQSVSQSSDAVESATATKSQVNQERRRIYVLGVGNLGRLFASSLMKLPKPVPITLVVHRKLLLEQWLSSPKIEMTRSGHVEDTKGFDVEWWTAERPSVGPVDEVARGGSISNLIVGTKASDAMPQIDLVRKYLDNTSTVAFVQNGMCKLWPPAGAAYNHLRFAPGREPNWVACVTTHGVISLGPFRSIHASPATVAVGPVLLNGIGEADPGDMMSQIVAAPELSARLVTTRDLWVLQLEKITVNSIINPLTAVLRCINGELLVNRDDELPALVDTLIKEASDLLMALVLDHSNDDVLRSDADEGSVDDIRAQLVERFSYPKLRQMFWDVAHKVGENRSSMFQDVTAGKQTEIDDFNGWLLETADRLTAAVELPSHRKLTSLVKNGAILSRSQLLQRIPPASRS